MEELLKSIKAYLYEKNSSPLFGAFILSWSIWNYRVIMMGLSSADIQEKFTYFDEYYSPVSFLSALPNFLIEYSGHFINALLAPAIITFLYIYAYPRLSVPVYNFSLGIQQVMRTIKQEKENQKLLSVKESRDLMARYTMIEQEHEKSLLEAKSQIKALAEQLKDNEALIEVQVATSSGATTTQKIMLDEYNKLVDEKNNNDLDAHRAESLIKLNNDEGIVMECFSKIHSSDGLDPFKLAEMTNLNNHIVQHSLDSLSSKAFLSGGGGLSGNEYSLREKGRKYIVEELLKNKD